MPRDAISVVRNVPVVTSLPASPADGEEVYYRFAQLVSPANPLVNLWHLRWDQAGGWWLPVGEQVPVYAFDGVQRSASIGAGGWGTNITPLCTATVPRPGSYRIEFGSQSFWAGTVGNWFLGLARASGWPGTPPGGGGLIVAVPSTATYDSAAGSNLIVAASGETFTHGVYLQATGGTETNLGRYIKLFPISLN
ncbi:MAG TPA: hypothetical protein VF076_05930 [Acidimicrobiales bacterium]